MQNRTQPKILAYTVAEAARELGVTPATIYAWLDQGALHLAEIAAGRIKLVEAKSLQALKSQRSATA